MAKRWLSVFLFVTVGVLFSCESTADYKYFEDFKFYMSEEFAVSIESMEDQVYYLLPLQGCESCVYMNTSSLDKVRNQLVRPVLIGSLSYGMKELQPIIDNIKSKLDCFIDENNAVRKYQIGLTKPILIHVKNGKCIYFQVIDDFSVEKAFNYISGVENS